MYNIVSTYILHTAHCILSVVQSWGAVERLLTKEQWQQTEADEGQKAGTVALVRCLSLCTLLIPAPHVT